MISKKYKIKIAVAPPQHLIGLVANSSIPILAQHVDNSNVGSTTGFMIPELLKKSKVSGSLINHSEHRISSDEISKLVLISKPPQTLQLHQEEDPVTKYYLCL